MHSKNKAAGAVVASSIILLSLLAYKLTGIASIISVLPIAIGFMIIGFCLRNKLKNINPVVTSITALLFALFTVCNYQFGAKSVNMSSMSLGIWLLYLLCGLSGSMLVICLAQMIGNSKVLALIGVNSLKYYGLHYEVLGIANKIRGGIIAAALTLAILFIAFFLFDKIVKKGRIHID